MRRGGTAKRHPVHLRTPSWVQAPDDYARQLGRTFGDPAALADTYWAYVDLLDLADLLALAVESDLAGHEAFYVASPDSPAGMALAAAVSSHCSRSVEVRSLDRVDASGVSSAKARRLLGYRPTRSWRHYVDATGRAARPAEPGMPEWPAPTVTQFPASRRYMPT